MGLNLEYLSGFGNTFTTEAKKKTVPIGRNSPQQAAHGLYAEQLSGTAFTAPRSKNLKSWTYRIQPSAVHKEFKSFKLPKFLSAPLKNDIQNPMQYRWDPVPLPKKKINFIESITTICANGSVRMNTGCATHIYSCTTSMESEIFSNSDGHLLIVPQEGRLLFVTELGRLEVNPSEIIVIPRGIRFRVELLEKQARGYICENYGTPFQLPELGPIGANGLANPRDFQIPVAWFENEKGTYEWINKYGGNFWISKLSSSPLNVVGWHGNYYPYKYDLNNFNTIGTISFDHPDPSIFTVLTSPSTEPGTANLDFVIFPPRWLVGENTFRPPYFHRNVMSEFMGLILGQYDAKTGGGFVPGGFSIHNRMAPHGPDSESFQKASQSKLEPEKINNTMAFMFESQYMFDLTDFAVKTNLLQKDYLDCWQGLKNNFK